MPERRSIRFRWHETVRRLRGDRRRVTVTIVLPDGREVAATVTEWALMHALNDAGWSLVHTPWTNTPEGSNV